jgi:hypothetical protein
MNSRPPLEEALGIPGARAVSLLDPERSAVLWWAGAGPPDERQTTAVVTLAAAAAGLVMLAEPGDELGDVLLTSAEAFHVVRLMTDGPLRVAHLTLRRTEANLAMARREFRSLIEAYARQPRHAAAQYDHPIRDDVAPEPGPAAGRAPLPRRDRVGPSLPAEATPPDLPPDLLDLLGQLYSADDGVLDRILATLHHL